MNNNEIRNLSIQNGHILLILLVKLHTFKKRYISGIKRKEISKF